MPYITQDRRDQYDYIVDDLITKLRENLWKEGDMNYVLYRICTAAFHSAPCYARINAIMGVLSCVASEFYRRVASKYEDEAIRKNGDIL